MFKYTSFSFIFFYLLTTFVFAAQGDVVPRKFLEPKDVAKLKTVEAKSWLANRQGKNSTTTTSTAAGVGKKSCVINIGTDNSNNKIPKPLGNSATNSQPIVISGDIVSVCK